MREAVAVRMKCRSFMATRWVCLMGFRDAFHGLKFLIWVKLPRFDAFLKIKS